jgi:hypothetical protein
VSCREPTASQLVEQLKRTEYDYELCTIEARRLADVDDRDDGTPVPSRERGGQTQEDRSKGFNDSFFFAAKPLQVDRAPMSECIDKFISTTISLSPRRDRLAEALQPEVLITFLTELTAQMFPRLTININAVRMHGTSAEKLDIINALIASRLLALSANESVSFSHISFYEFFFAKLLLSELSEWDATHLSRSNLIYSYNVNCFLIPMLLEIAPRTNLTPSAAGIRKQLERDHGDTSESFLTPAITQAQFREFVADTGWRRDTGFGQWMTFTDSSGNINASDGTIVPERHYLSLSPRPHDDGRFAVSLSWYDAFQFARWIGGTLPAFSELSSVDREPPEYEWTSSWSNEPESLIAVRSRSGGSKHGVNPDVRSSSIGFRVKIDRITGLNRIPYLGDAES